MEYIVQTVFPKLKTAPYVKEVIIFYQVCNTCRYCSSLIWIAEKGDQSTQRWFYVSRTEKRRSEIRISFLAKSCSQNVVDN